MQLSQQIKRGSVQISFWVDIYGFVIKFEDTKLQQYAFWKVKSDPDCRLMFVGTAQNLFSQLNGFLRRGADFSICPNLTGNFPVHPESNFQPILSILKTDRKDWFLLSLCFTPMSEHIEMRIRRQELEDLVVNIKFFFNL